MRMRAFKILTLAGVALLSASCGRNFHGTFQGPEQAQLGGIGLGGGYGGYYNPYCTGANGLATLTLSESRNSVTGSYQSACYTGTVQGQATDGQLSNAFMLITPVDSSSTGGSNNGSCGTYTGNLTENNGQLTGQFTTSSGGYYINPACPSVIAINFTRVNK